MNKWIIYMGMLCLLLWPVVMQASNGTSVPVKRIKTVCIQQGSENATVVFAAEELVKYWQKMTGLSLSIVKGKTVAGKLKKGNIYLSLDTAYGIKWDGYTITPLEEGMIIRASHPRGILYAVYQYLEACGCWFVYPDDKLWEQIPVIATAPLVSIAHTPRLEWRGLALYGIRDDQTALMQQIVDWMAKQRFNYVLLSQDRPTDGTGGLAQEVYFKGAIEKAVLPELTKRDFIINMGEHNTHEYLDRNKLFPLHPEWFALIKGKRQKGQMCYSNKEGLDYYATQLTNWVKDRPWVKIIGTWPLDGAGGYCQCDDCKSDQTIYNAISYVARKVKAVRPDVIVEHLAYTPETYEAPVKPLEDNMAVLYCPDLKDKPKLEAGWIKGAAKANGVYKFEYYLADHWRSPGQVWLRPDFALWSADYMVKAGFRGVVSLYLPIQMWWRSSLNYWFLSQGLWQEGVDTQERLKAFCAGYYAGSADKVQAIYNKILYEMQKGDFFSMEDPNRGVQEIRSRYAAAAAKPILTEIRNLEKTVNDTSLKTRIARIGDYVESMQLYFTYFATRKAADLEAVTNLVKQHNARNDGIDVPSQYFIWRVGHFPPLP